MAQGFGLKINKLITAIKVKHNIRLVYSSKQFYKPNGEKMTYYTVSEATYDPDKMSYVNMTVFSAGSMIQVVLFLRDFYYSLEGIEIPHDIEWWDKIKERKGVVF